MEMKMIGIKIARARKEINISQAELAKRLFISAQAVGKWERGESIPDIITFNRLAKILGVDLNYFSESFLPAADETPLKMTDANFGTINQTIRDNNNTTNSPELQLLTSFSGSNLSKSDFVGITANKMEFNRSMLRGSDFTDADLTGSSFKNSDLSQVNLNGANLTDCTISATDLKEANFSKTILLRTEISTSVLIRTKFIDTNLTGVKVTASDLRESVFENCIFNAVEFKNCDFRGQCFDRQIFIDVKFGNGALNNVTFKGATLKNVLFRAGYALTNKYYRVLKTICFDGAMMDKLTYVSLKGLGVDLSGVKII